ncbi:uncharacterized protein E0L32_009130 [Thyridium curvatum]|uniref:Uncharacterized protein n=1 Tax=Thyridium curvatum TaxID=1093900 RepID=A0A507AQG7_9PEZI|nr:uncharacterized protein E0L32_009130 [Thyridium curvatum]TPX09657.1 hypothetical protein E0L32_009130 [Thyridium curvatum]
MAHGHDTLTDLIHRVRREELYGNSSEEDDGPHDEAQDAEARAQLARLLGLDVSAGPDAAEAAEQPADGGAEQPLAAAQEEFEFRLFSAPSADAPAPKVVISPDEEAAAAADGNAGSIVAGRPLEYYVVGEPTGQQRARYEFAAVSGDDVLRGATRRSWGLEVPWRVRRVVLSARQLRALREHGWGPAEAALGSHGPLGGGSGSSTMRDSDEREKKKKRRPGKKRRIALRVKDRAEKEKAAAAEKSKISKEEHLREKKKRLNREKKLKRRQKAKEQKLAGKEAGGAGDEDGSSDSGGE